MIDLSIAEIEKRLAAPFDPREVKWKAQAVSRDQKKALAVAYIDARLVQDRLDEVLGMANWQDDYECLPDGAVVCRLRLRLGSEWITKTDVGGPSEQPDEGDRRKAAFSDALKRAAVKLGVARYLYRLSSQWVDYDAQRKQLVRVPALPASALPTQARPAPAPAKSATQDIHTGPELLDHLQHWDQALARAGYCEAGELTQAVVYAVTEAGHTADIASWEGEAITLGLETARAETARLRKDRLEGLMRQGQVLWLDLARKFGVPPARSILEVCRDPALFQRMLKAVEEEVQIRRKQQAGAQPAGSGR